jgi:serine/threonine-protein kinase
MNHQKKLGRYDLVRVLGKGSMGLVYEGRDPNLDRRVAIKTIKVENLSAEEAAEYEVRFRTEARSAGRLQHPNIVSVYDSDRDVDIAYLVMEFIQGDDLKHHLDNGESYTLEQAAGIMGDLLSALDYAHRQNVVHRDIKPANLLIEPSGRVKLTDFGVARIEESGEATRTQGSMVGTLKYMSPEQVQGLPVDARSDLFAAGIVFYQLITGKRPFEGAGDYDIIQQIISKVVAPPSTLNPQLPHEIDAVVARALEKARADRYPTAHAFNTALQAASRCATNSRITLPASRALPDSNATWTGTVAVGEALVNTNVGVPPRESVSVVVQEVELVYWKEVKDSNEREDLQGFLSRFPMGIYADLAKRRLKRLEMGLQTSDSGSSPGSPAVPDPDPTLPKAQVVTTPAQIPVRDGRDGAGKPSRERPKTVPAKKSVTFSRRMVGWLLTGLGLVAVIGVWKAFETKPPTVQAIAQQAPELAADVPATLASAPLVGASSPISPGTVPAPGAKVEPPLVAIASPANPVSAATKLRKPAPQASEKPTVAPIEIPIHPVDEKVLAPSTKATPLTITSAPAKSPVTSGDPSKVCEGRWLLAYVSCISEQCSKAQFTGHPVCVERRDMERRNTELEQRTR